MAVSREEGAECQSGDGGVDTIFRRQAGDLGEDEGLREGQQGHAKSGLRVPPRQGMIIAAQLAQSRDEEEGFSRPGSRRGQQVFPEIEQQGPHTRVKVTGNPWSRNALVGREVDIGLSGSRGMGRPGGTGFCGNGHRAFPGVDF